MTVVNPNPPPTSIQPHFGPPNVLFAYRTLCTMQSSPIHGPGGEVFGWDELHFGRDDAHLLVLEHAL